MLISGLVAVSFIALAALQMIKPGVLTGIPVAMNLFAGGMGALMCYVGWRAQKIRFLLGYRQGHKRPQESAGTP
jgi:hypothetical protein